MVRKPSPDCGKRANLVVKAARERLYPFIQRRTPTEAYTDLDEIWEFIAEDSQDAADPREGRDLPGYPRLLCHFRIRDTDEPTSLHVPLRFWRVRGYLIAYAPDEIPLLIVAVMHGSRSPRVMAAILRSRE